MEQRLSLEGLWAQAIAVIRARGVALGIVALLWALGSWLMVREEVLIALSDVVGYDEPAIGLVAVLVGLPGVIAMPVMLSIVARTGLAPRSPGAIAAHAALATVTVLIVAVLFGGGTALLNSAARASGMAESWLAYPLVFMPMVLQLAAFSYLGMMLPAALERPVGPFKALSVGLRLSRDRRIWLALISFVWTCAMTVPIHALTLFFLPHRGLSSFLALLGTMVSTFGWGVLYLELRRLHGAAAAAP